MSGGLFEQFKTWSAIERPDKPDFVEYLKHHSPWIFAHHPQSACFREHVWKINGLYVCKGCAITSVGFVVGLFVQIATQWLSHFSEESLGLIFMALLLPTLLTSSFRWPRVLRLASRVLLGFLMASALVLLFVTDRWDVRVVIIATYVVIQHIFEKKRRRANQQLLTSCKE